MAVKSTPEDAAVLESQRGFICSVGYIDQLALGQEQEKPRGSVSVTDIDLEIFVVVGGLVDFEAETKRLHKELDAAKKNLAGVERILNNKGFMAKAAPAIIEKKQNQKKEFETTIAQLQEQLTDFED